MGAPSLIQLAFQSTIFWDHGPIATQKAQCDLPEANCCIQASVNGLAVAFNCTKFASHSGDEFNRTDRHPC